MEIFKSVSIGAMSVKNRLVMAPLLTNLSEIDGSVTEALKEHYRKRAEGGVGLIITEGSCVDPVHRMSRNNLGIYEDRFIPGLRELTDQIHSWKCKIVMQLVHAMGMVDLKVVGTKPSQLTLRDIELITENFARSAVRAFDAGFDGVEFHMAHWYTVADFLSLSGNDRNDRYGRQSIETRTRLAVDILNRTRERVGDEFPLICRISGDEYLIGGNTLKQAVEIAEILVNGGADAVHVSAGNRIEDGGLTGFSSRRGHPDKDMPDAVNIHLAEGVRKRINVPVIGVGKIGKPEVAEEVIIERKSDLVALGRALVADAQFPTKAQAGEWDKINYCEYCNKCWYEVIKGSPLNCKKWPNN